MKFSLTFHLLAAASIATPSSFAATFLPLGDLPGGIFSSRAFGISADGTTVVGESVSPNGAEAFRWTEATGLVGLGDLPGGIFSSGAVAVSADGSVVVGSSLSATGRELYRWTASQGMVNLGDLPGGPVRALGQGISADGRVIIGTSDSEIGSEPYIWTAETGMLPLGLLSGTRIGGTGQGISDDGKVIVGQAFMPTASDRQAYRWTAETGFVGLGDLPGGPSFSVSLGVSPEGSVVGGWSFTGPSSFEATLWTMESGLQGLGTSPSAPGTTAWGLTDGGMVIVGAGSSGGPPAVIWDAQHGLRVLIDVIAALPGVNVDGWVLEDARDIRQTGNVFSIVGRGINPDGNLEAWLLRVTAKELGIDSDLLVDQLIARTAALVSDGGIANSLIAKLDSAIKALEKGNETAAINKLEAFVNQVSAQSGKQITAEDAAALIAACESIIAMLEGP